MHVGDNKLVTVVGLESLLLSILVDRCIALFGQCARKSQVAHLVLTSYCNEILCFPCSYFVRVWPGHKWDGSELMAFFLVY